MKNFKIQDGPLQLNGDPFIQHIKAQKYLPYPWKHIVSSWKSLGGELKKPNNREELLSHPIWGNKHFKINETINSDGRKTLKKHSTPVVFRDLWDSEAERWRVQDTDQPLVNAQRRQALESLINSLSNIFNLPAAVIPEIPALAGMILPDDTTLETNELNLKKIYYAWLMHKSTPHSAG
jgi:hypothetical protein